MKQQLNYTMHSLTLDNDPAFANYKAIRTSLQTAIYFCEPYKSYQKGAIENGNKLLRTKLPKETDINLFLQEDIDNITDQFNNRPMKCLNFKTPAEVFLQHLITEKHFLECRT